MPKNEGMWKPGAARPTMPNSGPEAVKESKEAKAEATLSGSTMGMKFMARKQQQKPQNKDAAATTAAAAVTTAAATTADASAKADVNLAGTADNKWSVVPSSTSATSAAVTPDPITYKVTLTQPQFHLPLPRHSVGDANKYVENLTNKRASDAKDERKFKKSGGVTDAEMVDFMVQAQGKREPGEKKRKKQQK
jgi:hypothetical protein